MIDQHTSSRLTMVAVFMLAAGMAIPIARLRGQLVAIYPAEETVPVTAQVEGDSATPLDYTPYNGPAIIRRLSSADCVVEELTNPFRPNEQVRIELPLAVNETGKREVRSLASNALVRTEADVVELVTKPGLIPEWFDDSQQAEQRLKLLLGDLVRSTYVGVEPKQRGGVNAIAELRDLLEAGPMPKIAWARTPAESAQLTGVSPLRFIPTTKVIGQDANGTEIFVFDSVIPYAWETFSVVRGKDGYPVDGPGGLPYPRQPEADIVAHVWLWYLLANDQGLNETEQLVEATKMNPLTNALAAIVYGWNFGKRLDSSAIEELFHPEFRQYVGAKDEFRRMPTAVFAVTQELSQLDTGVGDARQLGMQELFGYPWSE